MLEHVARGRTRYGAILHRLGRLEEAEDQLEQASVSFEERAVVDTSLADIRLEAGALRCDVGERNRGVVALRGALPFYRQHYGDEHWLTARTLIELARCTSGGGLVDRETPDPEALRRSRSILVQARGEESWDVARADTLLAER